MTRDYYARRATLLRTAKGVQWLGVLWNFLCWGYALWELATGPRFSDAVGDAIVTALVGGLGFSVAWVGALVIKVLALQKTAMSKTHKLPVAEAKVDDGGRDA